MQPNEQSAVFELDHDHHAPRVARDLVDAWLTEAGCDGELRTNTVLVVSELVTNAIVHAKSASKVRVSLRDGRVRVEVYDHGHRRPLERPSAGAAGGFGLRIVASLSESWGWDFTRSGKVVWAEAAPRT
jgi:anti-sigma regulatory factor (Ser/Thr protein kinase)